MTTENLSGNNNDIRQLAEKAVNKDKIFTRESLSSEQMQPILHELREHQVELEMQNEELRRTRHELEVSRARYFDMYDLAPIGYLTVSENGLITEANLTIANLLGVARSSLLKQPFSRYIFPDDQDAYHLQRKQIADTNTSQFWDTKMLHADGSTFQAHLQATLVQNGELRITVDDVTELWQARQELLKTQKLESLGILAGGIAHDFNNILAAILGNISLARLLLLNEPAKASKRLEEAEKATDRAKDIAKQLLTFARGGEPVKKNIDVRAILKEAAGFALLGSNVKCVLSIANDLLSVEADEGQIVQVIHNLVLNAVHAMPKGGTVAISADNVSALHSGKKYVKFSVSDTGVGISEQHLLKIFDPYFSTKQHGSGLGLATCYSIIKKHAGKIRAKSIVGVGSTFTISLPASIQEHVSDSDTNKALSKGCGWVLVMDDEEMIRDIMRALLEKLGYTVESVENGSKAIELYLQRKELGMPFSAVILDLTIPGGIGGVETIEKLHKIDPDVKAIVCSGYSNNPVMANYREYGFSGVLCKPFQMGELSNAMYDLLTPQVV